MTGSECTIILHRCHIHEDHIKLSFNIINIFVFILDIFVTSWIYVNFNLSDVKKLRLGPKGARRMASTMLGDSNGTSVGSLYTRVMVDLRDPRYDKTRTFLKMSSR